MKLTNKYLKQLIREELQQEGFGDLMKKAKGFFGKEKLPDHILGIDEDEGFYSFMGRPVLYYGQGENAGPFYFSDTTEKWLPFGAVVNDPIRMTGENAPWMVKYPPSDDCESGKDPNFPETAELTKLLPKKKIAQIGLGNMERSAAGINGWIQHHGPIKKNWVIQHYNCTFKKVDLNDKLNLPENNVLRIYAERWFQDKSADKTAWIDFVDQKRKIPFLPIS